MGVTASVLAGVRVGGSLRHGDECSGDRGGPGLAPHTEFLTVGEAHEVAVPRGLKIQTLEPDFEPGGKGVVGGLPEKFG
jgi:hypothetical protein